MTFAAPWALAGLLALPILIWLHVRRRRPPVVQTSSLMFVLDEEERTRLPRGRRLDAELLLTLAAASLLVLAAAGPTTETREAARVVRVAVVGGASATRDGYSQDVQNTLDAMGRTLASGDRLDVQWVPPQTGAWTQAPHPSLDRVLGVARAGSATVRYVISDRLPDPLPEDVAWIALGEPRAYNAGIVSARMVRASGRSLVHVVVAHTPVTESLLSFLKDAGALTPTKTPGISTATIPMPAADQPLTLRLKSIMKDSLPIDDRVTVSAGRLQVNISEDLPATVQTAVRAALQAASPRVTFGAAATADLVVGLDRPADSTNWFVGLTALGTRTPTTVPAGAEVRATSLLVQDLSLNSTAWQLPGAPSSFEEDRILLARRTGSATWPILVREGVRGVRLLAVPPASSNPFWPIFFANVLDAMRGPHDAGAGVHVEGVMDRAVTAIGRDQSSFRPEALAAVPRERMDVTTPWRVPLALLALALLALLWIVPIFRARPAVVPTA